MQMRYFVLWVYGDSKIKINSAKSAKPESLYVYTKWDVIKQNELKLTNNVFKIQSKKAYRFVCFFLFMQSFICLYLGIQLSNLWGFTKLKPKQYHNRKCQEAENHIFWLILLDRITNIPLKQDNILCIDQRSSITCVRMPHCAKFANSFFVLWASKVPHVAHAPLFEEAWYRPFVCLDSVII